MKKQLLILLVAVLLAVALLPLELTLAQEPECGQGECKGVAGVGAEGAEAEGLTAYRLLTLRGGYVAKGTGMRNRGYGRIPLWTIPPGAKVYRAYLYWGIIDYYPRTSHRSGVINGKRIWGSYIGGDHQPCWIADTGSLYAYRADVTAHVKGNGLYKLWGFASGRTDGADPWKVAVKPPLAEGASLVVFFYKPTYPLTRFVIWDGAASTPMTANTMWIRLGGFSATRPVGPAYTTFIGADGQKASEPASTFNGHPVPQADWDGTDPNWGPNFSQGNLWDTDTASVGAFIKPGNTSARIEVKGSPDCLVWVAQIFSISSGTVDTDGDALKDGWEANGYDYNNDGKVDVNLPAMGANPFHKDIFVEHDWMAPCRTCKSHQPSWTVLNRVKSAFAAAPVSNPDGRWGIKLHNDRGQRPYYGGNQVAHKYDIAPTNATLWSEFDKIKNANFAAARRDIFHYVLWAHDLTPAYGSTSGISRGIPASDFIVSLGSWPGCGDTNARTGTFMHELGHNLGLTHGGNAGDHVNYKPNHLSVMNYSFQVIGVPRNTPTRRLWDFTRMHIASLNENNLNEVTGLHGSASLATYGTRYYCPTTHATRDDWTADTYVDWNCNGTYQTSVAADINKSNTRTVLGWVRHQWPAIVYNGGSIGGVPGPVGVSAAEFMEHLCLSYEDVKDDIPPLPGTVR